VATTTTAATGDSTVEMVFVMAGVKQNPHPERVEQDGGNDDYLLEARYIALSLNYNDALLLLSLLLATTTTTTTKSSPPPPSLCSNSSRLWYLSSMANAALIMLMGIC
jgi:hypothetical protein